MLEMLLSPRKAERKPWEMLLVGIFYASLSFLLVTWIFGQDAVLSKSSGILIITFTVMFTMPFMYYLIKNEEERDLKTDGSWNMLKEHRKAIVSLMFLFFGFIIGFSIWYMVFNTGVGFNAQIETYCSINSPSNFDSCVAKNSLGGGSVTGAVTSGERFLIILENNIYVLIFTLVFSLIFGAGAIFVLAWNASVIAVAVGIFSKMDITQIPLALLRYMVHGSLEIGGYFIGALAGGIISIAVIRHDTKSEKFWDVVQDSIDLIILAVVLLVVGAFVEVFVTPAIFS